MGFRVHHSRARVALCYAPRNDRLHLLPAQRVPLRPLLARPPRTSAGPGTPRTAAVQHLQRLPGPVSVPLESVCE